jgi:hypothetical protein
MREPQISTNSTVFEIRQGKVERDHAGGLVWIFEDAEARRKTFATLYFNFGDMKVARKLYDKVREVGRFI